MALLNQFSSGPDRGAATATRSIPRDAFNKPSVDAGQPTARSAVYGLAIVFALMLILLVVIATMLWTG